MTHIWNAHWGKVPILAETKLSWVVAAMRDHKWVSDRYDFQKDGELDRAKKMRDVDLLPKKNLNRNTQRKEWFLTEKDYRFFWWASSTRNQVATKVQVCSVETLIAVAKVMGIPGPMEGEAK